MRASRQRLRAFGALMVAAGLLAAGCGSDDDSGGGDTTAAAAPAETSAAGGDTTAAGGDTTAAASGDLAALVEAATEEGKVNLIALPDSWANYKGILQSFRDKYPGIENPVATPDASSADEITAVKTLAGQADMPDSIDVGPPFAIQAIDEGLWEPYQGQHVGRGPGRAEGSRRQLGRRLLRHHGHRHQHDHRGQPAEDLRRPEEPDYKGQVGLNGDPREAGAAFAAVMAASLANGGSFDDIMPGIQFFADLKKPGNLVPGDVPPTSRRPVPARRRSISTGRTTGPACSTNWKRRASPPRSSSRPTGCMARTTPRAW